MAPPELPILPILPSSTTTRISGLGSLPVQSRRLACSSTTVTPTMYRIASDVQVDQEEVGRVGDQEPQQDSPSQAGGAGHPAADVEHLVDHVDQRPGGQSQGEHTDIG